MALTNWKTAQQRFTDTLADAENVRTALAIAMNDKTRTESYKAERKQALLANYRGEVVRDGKAYVAAMNGEEAAAKKRAAEVSSNLTAGIDFTRMDIQAREFASKFTISETPVADFSEAYEAATLAQDKTALRALRLIGREQIITSGQNSSQTAEQFRAVELKLQLQRDEEAETAAVPGMASVTATLRELEDSRSRLALDLARVESEMTGRLYQDVIGGGMGTWAGAVLENTSATTSNPFDWQNVASKTLALNG